MDTTQALVTCTNCGRTNSDRSRPCAHCGAVLTAPPQGPVYREPCPRCYARVGDAHRAVWLRGPRGYMQPYHNECARIEIEEDEQAERAKEQARQTQHQEQIETWRREQEEEENHGD